MALKKCNECGKEFSEKADKCPNCGNPNNQQLKETEKTNVWSIIRYIIGSLFILGSLANNVNGNWYGLIELLFGLSWFPIIYTNVISKFIKDVKVLKILQIILPIVLIIIFFIATPIDTDVDYDDNTSNNNSETVKEKDNKELTESEKMIIKISSLFDEKLAFDTGSYIQGDIPAGEYAFVKFSGSGSYYEEEDAAGNIIDNENFDSFGYVKVHSTGNLETDGVLVNIIAFEKLEVSGAKELYEILNDKKDWNQSGHYKVGVDIEPGKYILESIGSGYWEIASGPIGASDIVDNDNFNGRSTVNVKNGQYLQLSRAQFTKPE